MLEIAKKVGCRSPSLYHHFESRQDIFRALVDRGLRLYEHYRPSIDSADPLAQLRWRFWRYYEFSKAHPEYFALIFVDLASPPGDEALLRRVLSGAETRRRFKACLDLGVIPSGSNPAQVVKVLWCAIHGAAVMGLRGRTPGKDDLANWTLDLAIDGVCSGLLLKRPQPRPSALVAFAGRRQR